MASSKFDDTLDVFPCHGVGGIAGMILTGVFAKDLGLYYGTYKTFVIHIAALLMITLFCVVMSYVLYEITDRIVPLRVGKEDEILGLDISQHAESV